MPEHASTEGYAYLGALVAVDERWRILLVKRLWTCPTAQTWRLLYRPRADVIGAMVPDPPPK